MYLFGCSGGCRRGGIQPILNLLLKAYPVNTFIFEEENIFPVGKNVILLQNSTIRPDLVLRTTSNPAKVITVINFKALRSLILDDYIDNNNKILRAPAPIRDSILYSQNAPHTNLPTPTVITIREKLAANAIKTDTPFSAITAGDNLLLVEFNNIKQRGRNYNHVTIGNSAKLGYTNYRTEAASELRFLGWNLHEFDHCGIPNPAAGEIRSLKPFSMAYPIIANEQLSKLVTPMDNYLETFSVHNPTILDLEFSDHLRSSYIRRVRSSMKIAF